MKKLILALAILVVVGGGVFCLYKFTNVFPKPADTTEVVPTNENVETEVVLEAEKQVSIITNNIYYQFIIGTLLVIIGAHFQVEKVGKKWPQKWADIEQMSNSYKILIKKLAFCPLFLAFCPLFAHFFRQKWADIITNNNKNYS